MTSIAHDFIEDIIAELKEIGLDDLAAHITGYDERSLAIVAAYVADRDSARGMSVRWLVEGKNAPRLGINCSSRRKALAYVSKLGDGHTIRVGYGDLYTWRAINVDAIIGMARKVAA